MLKPQATSSDAATLDMDCQFRVAIYWRQLTGSYAVASNWIVGDWFLNNYAINPT